MSKELHLEKNKIIFGPVQSRRFGSSLGINPLPLGKKSCSYDCVYCQLGRTDNSISDPSCLKGHPSPDDIVNAFERELDSLIPLKIDAITFAGNGEPTLNPDLFDVVSRIKEKMRVRGLRVPVSILTNSSLLHFPSVRKNLKHFDIVVAKLDTVDQDCFISLNRPAIDFKVRDIVSTLVDLRREINEKLILQVMLIDSKQDGMIANSTKEKIVRLAEAASEIDPAHIQIYSIDRAPSEKHVIQVDNAVLNQAAEVFRKKIGRNQVQIY